MNNYNIMKLQCLFFLLLSNFLFGQDCFDHRLTLTPEFQGNFTILNKTKALRIDNCQGETETKLYTVFKMPANSSNYYVWTDNLNVDLYYQNCCDEVVGSCANKVGRNTGEIILLEGGLCSDANSGYVVAVSDDAVAFNMYIRDLGGLVTCSDISCEEEECTPIELDHCFFYTPISTSSDGSGLYRFVLDDISEARDATSFEWYIDDEQIATSEDRSTEFRLPGSRSVRICVKWKINTGELEKCYEACKTICIIDPFDCEKFWWYPIGGFGDKYKFKAGEGIEVISWEVHDNDRSYQRIEKEQMPEISKSIFDKTSDVYMTLTYKDRDGCIRICCRKICVKTGDRVVPFDQIGSTFIGTEEEVSAGRYRYSFKNLMPGANVLKWKAYPLSNTSAVKESTSSSPEFDLIHDGSEQSIWRICFIYLDRDGCIQICCIDVCLTNPYGCGGLQKICRSEDEYQISNVLGDNTQVLYWTDANGNRLSEYDGQKDINYKRRNGNQYVYCYYYECIDDGEIGSYCWLRVCCIPVPPCKEDCKRIEREVCYYYVPISTNSDGSGKYRFSLEDIPELRKASEIEWYIDDEKVATGTTREAEVVIPGGGIGRSYKICVRWYVDTEEGRMCYEICKTICIIDPFDCDRFWWYPVGQLGDKFKFKPTGDIEVISWEIHDRDRTYQRIDKEAMPEISKSVFDKTGEVYMTLTYKDKDGCIWICCRRICLKGGEGLIPHEQIGSTFIGTEEQVKSGRYRYQFKSLMPGAQVIKWKAYPLSNTSAVKESTSSSPEFDLIHDGSEQSVWRICFIYVDRDGCIRICCIDVCLTSPFGCGGLQKICNGEDEYQISNILGNNTQVLYWTDANGNRLSEYDGQKNITYKIKEGNKYVYCYYYECLDLGEGAFYCWLRVCCIPVPPCNPGCYDGCCPLDADLKWLELLKIKYNDACADCPDGTEQNRIYQTKDENGRCIFMALETNCKATNPDWQTFIRYFDCYGNEFQRDETPADFGTLIFDCNKLDRKECGDCFTTSCGNDDIIADLINSKNPTTYSECINSANGETIIVLGFDPLPLAIDDEYSELYNCRGDFLEKQGLAFPDAQIELSNCTPIRRRPCCFDDCCKGADRSWLDAIIARKNCQDSSTVWGPIFQGYYQGKCVWVEVSDEPLLFFGGSLFIYDCAGNAIDTINEGALKPYLEDYIERPVLYWSCYGQAYPPCKPKTACPDFGRKICADISRLQNGVGIAAQSNNWKVDAGYVDGLVSSDGQDKFIQVGQTANNDVVGIIYDIPRTSNSITKLNVDVRLDNENGCEMNLYDIVGNEIQFSLPIDANGNGNEYRIITNTDDKSIQTNFKFDVWLNFEFILDSAKGSITISENGKHIYSGATNLKSFASIGFYGALNSANTYFDVKDVCIAECGEKSDCIEINGSDGLITWGLHDALNNEYKFTFLEGPSNYGAKNIRWCIDDVYESSASNSRNIILPFPGDGTYRICVKFELETAHGTVCYKICRTICLANPFDPDNCADIAFYALGDQKYQLVAEGVKVLSWRIDKPINRVIGNGNPQLLDLKRYNLASKEVVISVTYLDPSGCIKTCCKKLCDILIDPFDPTTDFCNKIDYRYTGEGYVYEFFTKDPSDGDPIIFIRGENDAMNNSEKGIQIIDDNGDVDLDGTDGIVRIDLAKYKDKGTIVVCFQYVDANGCLKICCKRICIIEVQDNEDCDDILFQPNTTEGKGVRYDFKLNKENVSYIEWTLHEGSGTKAKVIATDETELSLDFLELGYTYGQKVCVTVRYFDKVDKCFKICCKCFYLVDPYSCGDLLLREEKGAFFVNLGSEFASDLIWKVPVDFEKTGARGIKIYRDNIKEGETIVVHVLFYDKRLKAWRRCCVKITNNGVTDCTGKSISLGPDQVLCEGQSITLSISSDASDIVWKRDGNMVGDGKSELEIKEAGEYVVSATLPENCPVADTIVVETMAEFEIKANVKDATCGEDNGEIELMLPEGVKVSSYIWNDSLPDTKVLRGLSAGKYSVKVVTTSGCSSSAEFEIKKGERIAVKDIEDITICSGVSGTVKLVQEEGEAEKITWYKDGKELDASSESLEINEPGQYSVKVENEAGCTDQKSFNVFNSSEPTVVSKVVQPDCDQNNGSISLSVFNLEVVKYKWEGDYPESSMIEGLGAGTYDVEITDSKGCVFNKAINLGSSSNVTVKLEEDQTLCAGSYPTTTTATIVGEYESIVWTKDDEVVNREDTAIMVVPGKYVLEVIDNKGCKLFDEVVFSAFDDEVNLPDTVITIKEGERFDVNLGDVSAVDLQTESVDVSCSDCPEFSIEGTNSGQVDLVITTNNDCVINYSFKVNVETSPKGDIPFNNYMSVNNDGENDYLEFEGIEQYTTRKLVVFNKWGRVLVIRDNYNNDWDGVYKGSPLPDGVYYFRLEYGDGTSIKVVKGDITIIK